MNKVDLWADNEDIIENKPIEPIVDLEPTEEVKIKKASKKTKVKDLSKLYVITAGLNRATGRQMFISTFQDSDEWSISVVPTILEKPRALKLMEIAQQYVNDNPKRFRYKPPTLALESIEKPEIYSIVRCLLR